MSETGATPGDSHFIDWSLLMKQALAARRIAGRHAAAAAVTVAGSEDGERGGGD
jgi:hypothetical protein